MQLTQSILEELLEIAKQAARAAGDIISRAQGELITVNHKQAGENIASCVVTQVDLDAQEAIIKILGPSIEKFDLGLLAEESSDDSSRLTKDYFWCIDPLDGTLAFSRNEDGYSTSIALVSKSGDSIIGVVYNPRAKDIYYAIKGCGAFKNDISFCVEKNSSHLTLLYDKSFLQISNFDIEMELLEKNASKIGLSEVKLHHLGGAVMNGISTIELSPAIYYKHPKKADGGGSIWDFAASSIIQSEANGYNSDYNSRALNLNRSDTTFMNNSGVIFCSSKKDSKVLIPRKKL